MMGRIGRTPKEEDTCSDLKGTENFDSGKETIVNKKGKTKQTLKLLCHSLTNECFKQNRAGFRSCPNCP